MINHTNQNRKVRPNINKSRMTAAKRSKEGEGKAEDHQAKSKRTNKKNLTWIAASNKREAFKWDKSTAWTKTKANCRVNTNKKSKDPKRENLMMRDSKSNSTTMAKDRLLMRESRWNQPIWKLRDKLMMMIITNKNKQVHNQIEIHHKNINIKRLMGNNFKKLNHMDKNHLKRYLRMIKNRSKHIMKKAHRNSKLRFKFPHKKKDLMKAHKSPRLKILPKKKGPKKIHRNSIIRI